MATPKQRAAARRNIKKAQAALRRKRGGRKKAAPRKRATSRKRRRNPAPARKRTTTRRKTVAARKRAPARRRRRTTRRRNPAMLKQLQTGLKDAAGILVGKAGARILPTLIPQVPRAGPIGLIVQMASAVALGYGADRFLSRDVARQILAGGLSAPLETAAVAYNVPFLGDALNPVRGAAEVAALRSGSGTGVGRLKGYVPERGRAAALSGYVPSPGYVPGLSY